MSDPQAFSGHKAVFSKINGHGLRLRTWIMVAIFSITDLKKRGSGINWSIPSFKLLRGIDNSDLIDLETSKIENLEF